MCNCLCFAHVKLMYNIFFPQKINQGKHVARKERGFIHMHVVQFNPRDSLYTVNCNAEQKQPLGFSSLFESLKRRRCSSVALIDFCLSSDTMSCQITGKCQYEVVVGYITSAITTEVRSWSVLHLYNSIRGRCYVHLMYCGFTELLHDLVNP